MEEIDRILRLNLKDESQTQNYLRIVQRYLRMVENFAMLHYSLLQRAPPENHCVLTQPRWPLRSNCCPAVQFDGGADRSLLDSRGARALSGFLSPLGSCSRLTSIWGLAGNARIVANAAEPFDPPEQIVIRESIDCVKQTGTDMRCGGSSHHFAAPYPSRASVRAKARGPSA